MRHIWAPNHLPDPLGPGNFTVPSRFRGHWEAIVNECYYHKWDTVKRRGSVYGNINADHTEKCAEVRNLQK
jgi:hypothetical protein